MKRADRKSLLLGTALASTLLFGSLIAPAPASAQATCAPFVGTSPAPISLYTNIDPIVCNNDEPRTNNGVHILLPASVAIELITAGDNNSIRLDNSGTLFAEDVAIAHGILALSGFSTTISPEPAANNPIFITNSGRIVVNVGDDIPGLELPSAGILGVAFANGPGSFVRIENDGEIEVEVGAAEGDAVGVGGLFIGADGYVHIENSGHVTVTAGDGLPIDDQAAVGLGGLIDGNNSSFYVRNDGGDLTVTVGDGNNARAIGIYAAEEFPGGDGNTVHIINDGNIKATAGNGYGAIAAGILARRESNESSIEIENSGTIEATSNGSMGVGIFAQTEGDDSSIEIENSGRMEVTGATSGNFPTGGILASAGGIGSNVYVENSGALTVEAADGSTIGIFTVTGDLGTGTGSGDISIVNNGDVWVRTGDLTPSGGLPAAGIVGLAWGPNSSVHIENNSAVTVTVEETIGVNTVGVAGSTFEADSLVDVRNRGDITVTVRNATGSLVGGHGSRSYGDNSEIDVVNDGGNIKLTVVNADNVTASAILGHSVGSNSHVNIENIDGKIEVNSGDGDNSRVFGIYGGAGFSLLTPAFGSPVEIRNSGDIAVTVGRGDNAVAAGIFASGYGGSNPLDIVNSGDILARVGAGQNGTALGIAGFAMGDSSPVKIENSGDIVAAGGLDQGPYLPTPTAGIFAFGDGTGSYADIENRGDIEVTVSNIAGGFPGAGILGVGGGEDSFARIDNRGAIKVTSDDSDNLFIGGIVAVTNRDNSFLDIQNRGAIEVIGGNGSAFGNDNVVSVGILVMTGNAENPPDIYGNGSPITILNRGDINASIGDGDRAIAGGIGALTVGDDSFVDIVNHGDIRATTGTGAETRALGIYAHTGFDQMGILSGDRSFISIVNHGDIVATGSTYQAYAILAVAEGPNSPISIVNSGSVFGGTGGIVAASDTSTTIINSGFISAGTLRAIDVNGNGGAEIFNTGRITGFVELTDNDDRFINQAGGVFETKRTSNFGLGNDLFRNESGGTVQAASNPNVRELSAFTNLNRFENRGLISLQDGRAGDVFEISNTSPQARDLVFVASGNSTLAVDAFLGGPSSISDEFIVNGEIRGRTALLVNNTNPGLGAAGGVIPVIFANGDVKPDAFFMSQPIDTGFFAYDLFFRPTNSGIFELRSIPGGGAFLLPQLVTGAQDIWHQGSSTWFDRTADLRVLMAGGAAPIAYDPSARYASGEPAGPAAFTPAVWARGSGAWLDRDATARSTAFGRTYDYNLDRELDVIDWQMGLDLGHRDLFSSGDILVFGVLGGFVGASLDYDHIARHFDFSGAQVGGYATYLRGGLFVDTLFNAHLLEMETASLGFPGSLDVTTLGLRTDAGYRFGSFSGGAFIEPLATISVLWADIDGFSSGGNAVSFDDDANVRGRLGLRVGTSYAAWGTTTVEPFVIGSLWGHLSGDNQATLVSNGTTFRFEDDLDDVWGEVSLGVNFFNPSAGTAVFAKVDVTFGDDVDGIGGKAGMRVAW